MSKHSYSKPGVYGQPDPAPYSHVPLPPKAPPGNVDPPGKIGGYADSPGGTKDPQYENRIVAQNFDRGQAGVMVEGGPDFSDAKYKDLPPGFAGSGPAQQKSVNQSLTAKGGRHNPY